MVEYLNNRGSIENEKKGYNMISKAENEINIEEKLKFLIEACEYFLISIKYSNTTEKIRLRSICDKYIKIAENLKIQLLNEKKFFNNEQM